MPSKTTLPPLGSSSRLMQRSSVLLPEPEGPMMKTSSRSLTERSMPFKTSVAPKLFLRPAMRSIAMPGSSRRGEAPPQPHVGSRGAAS